MKHLLKMQDLSKQELYELHRSLRSLILQISLNMKKSMESHIRIWLENRSD